MKEERYIVACPNSSTGKKLKKYVASREGICPACGEKHEPIGTIKIDIEKPSE